MANEWLRLWHDMPNDPKWRTISSKSGQPIALVISVYTHLLVDASRNVTRGHINVTAEDLASALNVTEEQIQLVFDAMQGRVLSDGKLSGWELRQPIREDAGNPETGAKSAAQRQREKRERDRELQKEDESHAKSRNVTTDKDKDKDIKTIRAKNSHFDVFWEAYPSVRKVAKKNCQQKWAAKKLDTIAAKIISDVRAKAGQWGEFAPSPLTYLNQERWNDGATDGGNDWRKDVV